MNKPVSLAQQVEKSNTQYVKNEATIHWGGREEAQFYKIAHFTTIWSQPGYELQLLQIKKLSWKHRAMRKIAGC